MKYCVQCGSQLSDDAQFCHKCGKACGTVTGQVETVVSTVSAEEKTPLETAKLVCGIISMGLFIVTGFQSCAANFADSLSEEKTGDGAVGILVALLFLVGGSIGIAGRKSRGGCIAATIVYAIAAFFAFIIRGSFPDMLFWAIVCVVFAIIFYAGTPVKKKNSAIDEAIIQAMGKNEFSEKK